MLETIKSTTITGYSKVKDMDGVDQTVVYMNASVAEGSGVPNGNRTIQNTELYLANKEQCRADMSAFDDAIDELLSESEEK